MNRLGRRTALFAGVAVAVAVLFVLALRDAHGYFVAATIRAYEEFERIDTPLEVDHAVRGLPEVDVAGVKTSAEGEEVSPVADEREQDAAFDRIAFELVESNGTELELDISANQLPTYRVAWYSLSDDGTESILKAVDSVATTMAVNVSHRDALQLDLIRFERSEWGDRWSTRVDVRALREEPGGLKARLREEFDADGDMRRVLDLGRVKVFRPRELYPEPLISGVIWVRGQQGVAGITCRAWPGGESPRHWRGRTWDLLVDRESGEFAVYASPRIETDSGETETWDLEFEQLYRQSVFRRTVPAGTHGLRVEFDAPLQLSLTLECEPSPLPLSFSLRFMPPGFDGGAPMAQSMQWTAMTCGEFEWELPAMYLGGVLELQLDSSAPWIEPLATLDLDETSIGRIDLRTIDIDARIRRFELELARRNGKPVVGLVVRVLILGDSSASRRGGAILHGPKLQGLGEDTMWSYFIDSGDRGVLTLVDLPGAERIELRWDERVEVFDIDAVPERLFVD